MFVKSWQLSGPLTSLLVSLKAARWHFGRGLALQLSSYWRLSSLQGSAGWFDSPLCASCAFPAVAVPPG